MAGHQILGIATSLAFLSWVVGLGGLSALQYQVSVVNCGSQDPSESLQVTVAMVSASTLPLWWQIASGFCEL
jgi:hypothetical protein